MGKKKKCLKNKLILKEIKSFLKMNKIVDIWGKCLKKAIRVEKTKRNEQNI